MAKKECILVADDAAIDRRIVRMLLHRDFEVEEATDGLDAIKHLEANPDRYACVLLDMLMPVMDGFKVMAFMQDRGLLDKVPVVALTAISDAEGHIKCYESGAIDIIEKPFDNRMLQYKLRFNISRFQRLRGVAAQGPAAGSSTSETAAPLAHGLVAGIRHHLKGSLGLSDEELPAFLTTFMETFTECVDTLKGLSTPPDCQVIRNVTHKVYGFAQSIGAPALNDVALLLNAAAKQNDPDACNAGIRLMLSLYGECLSDLKKQALQA